jgi:hypothetical protein
LTAVWLLGLKVLLYDVLAKNVSCGSPTGHAVSSGE